VLKLIGAFELHPFSVLPAGSLSAAATAGLVGESVIRYHSRPAQQVQLSPAPA
jgi:hypothetical protein